METILWLIITLFDSGFATDPNFRSFQASAMARAGQAGNHPMFLGEAGLWNGQLLADT